MAEIRSLTGCRLEPLASYLKSLGILRLVAEQADPGALGWWEGENFNISADLGDGGLEAFFLDRYRPTPLVSPWNGGSGFAAKDKEALVAVGLILTSEADRLALYREAIQSAQAVAHEAASRGWGKEQVLQACRGRLPDACVAWIDAAVVLTAGTPKFPPLLGSGGNDGRLDFSANFMHRLADALSLRAGRNAPTRETSAGWLDAALYAGGAVPGVRAAVGQFDPGSAGGVNSSPLGAAPSLVNPWDFILMLEGALLFAGGAARRLGSDTEGRAAMPFMVDSSPVGYPSSAAGEKTRGELWAPRWHRPAPLAEIAHLFEEGRSEWQGHQARTGLDMVRAAATLGNDRGVDDFVRYVFVERRGLSTAAVGVGRITTGERSEVPLLGQVDRWLQSVRGGKESPAGVGMTLRRVDKAMFTLATAGGSRRLQDVLRALSELEAALGNSVSFRVRARIRPLQGLPAVSWLPHLDDGSPEFGIAAALASLHDPDGTCLRMMLRPVTRASKGPGLDWNEGSPEVPGFGVRPFVAVLADAHARRSIEVASASDGGIADGTPGVQTAFAFRLPAPGPDAARFAAGELDDVRVAELFGGLMLLDWQRTPQVGGWQAYRGRLPPPPAWAVLAPFFHGRPLRDPTVTLRPEASWPALLVAGREEVVLKAALRRLRIARLDAAPADARVMAASAPPGPRLAAGLLVPIGGRECAHLLNLIVPQPIGPLPEEA